MTRAGGPLPQTTIDVWTARLLEESADLDFTSSEDRATFRGLVANATKNLRASGLRDLAAHFGAEPSEARRRDQSKVLADAWIKRTLAISAAIDAEHCAAVGNGMPACTSDHVARGVACENCAPHPAPEPRELTHEQVDAALEELTEAMSSTEILAVPGVYEVLREYLNNEAITLAKSKLEADS